MLQHIFKQIFQDGLELQEDRIVEINGDGNQYFIVGPYAVKSYEQVHQVDEAMKERRIIRFIFPLYQF